MSEERKRRPPMMLRMMLHIVLLLLITANTGWLHAILTPGMNHRLHCVNDFIFTINCTVSFPPSESSSSLYWLTLEQLDEEEKYRCKLMKTERDYFCSFKKPEGSTILTDLDTYEISLCHREPENCEQLDGEYIPMMNIKPKAPCCLTVAHNSSQYDFSWESSYEEFSPYSALTSALHYQIHCYRASDNVSLHNLSSYNTRLTVDDEEFLPDTDYAARVRTKPNQMFYQGEWSDWSSEVRWKATNQRLPAQTLAIKKTVSEVGKKALTFMPLYVVGILAFLFCYIAVKRWRQSVFIPTPAPYFDTLYGDCHGDFKSWVVTQENAADILKTEETLQIDTLTKCEDEREGDRPPPGPRPAAEGGTYCNLAAPACDPGTPGVPCAGCTVAPACDPGTPGVPCAGCTVAPACDPGTPGVPYAGCTVAPACDPGTPGVPYAVAPPLTPPYCQPGGAGGDSGRCLCSEIWQERDNLWYCNEYCSLSAFQHSHSVPAEQHVGLETKSQMTGSG